MSAPLIEARGLGKAYPKVHRNADRLRSLGRLLLGIGERDRISVLKDVDLSVARGESLGLIGENGAGKSTLLKLVTGVLTPSAGSVRVNGTIGALLELGAGFHPEYTGRDNIAMAAALYGLDGARLRERIPEIIAFADIGDYIDEPVKHYSSGMVVRLGFAVVASLKPDILVTDEVLAVGDESFQKKCVRWIEDYLAGGGTLILVSHSMYHVQKLCRHALWLRAGEIAMYGDVFDVTQAYLAYHERKSGAPETSIAIASGLEFGVLGVEVNGYGGEQPTTLDRDAALSVAVRLHSRDGRVPCLAIGIVRADGTPVYGVSSEMDGVAPQRAESGEYHAAIEFDALPLLPGSYTIRVHPMDPEGVRLFETVERGLVVRGASREFGLVRLAHRWSGVGESGDAA
ncbi:MAG TPA: ABC transporter ATP-binding protein [Rhodanobacteraceae bacterium]|nr:ABC transporter ATP-binding protein [Rhodanobacteraceae bacterium]